MGPASVCLQWRDEMSKRFGLQFERIATSRPFLGSEKKHYDKSPGEIDLGTPIGEIPEWLFPGAAGDNPLSQVRTGQLVSAAYQDAGIGGHRPGLHRLRKSWATGVLRKGADLGTLMRWGGWDSLKTVEQYIGSADDAARAAIDSLDY